MHFVVVDWQFNRRTTFQVFAVGFARPLGEIVANVVDVLELQRVKNLTMEFCPPKRVSAW